MDNRDGWSSFRKSRRWLACVCMAALLSVLGCIPDEGDEEDGINPSQEGPVLESLGVSNSSFTLFVDQFASVTIFGHYSDGSTQDLTAEVDWSNSDPSVADIVAGSPAEIHAVDLGNFRAVRPNQQGCPT